MAVVSGVVRRLSALPGGPSRTGQPSLQWLAKQREFARRLGLVQDREEPSETSRLADAAYMAEMRRMDEREEWDRRQEARRGEEAEERERVAGEKRTEAELMRKRREATAAGLALPGGLGEAYRAGGITAPGALAVMRRRAAGEAQTEERETAGRMYRGIEAAEFPRPEPGYPALEEEVPEAGAARGWLRARRFQVPAEEKPPAVPAWQRSPEDLAAEYKELRERKEATAGPPAKPGRLRFTPEQWETEKTRLGEEKEITRRPEAPPTPKRLPGVGYREEIIERITEAHPDIERFIADARRAQDPSERAGLLQGLGGLIERDIQAKEAYESIAWAYGLSPDELDRIIEAHVLGGPQ